MALFSRKKDLSPQAGDSKKENQAEEQKGVKKEVATVVKKDAQVSKALPTDVNLSSVIIKPRVTEKGVSLGEKNVYTFVVKQDASKYEVKDAIKELFDVTPTRVNIVNKAPRQYKSRSKGRMVTEKGLKKAYVYLKDGDSINLV